MHACLNTLYLTNSLWMMQPESWVKTLLYYILAWWLGGAYSCLFDRGTVAISSSVSNKGALSSLPRSPCHLGDSQCTTLLYKTSTGRKCTQLRPVRSFSGAHLGTRHDIELCKARTNCFFKENLHSFMIKHAGPMISIHVLQIVLQGVISKCRWNHSNLFITNFIYFHDLYVFFHAYIDFIWYMYLAICWLRGSIFIQNNEPFWGAGKLET